MSQFISLPTLFIVFIHIGATTSLFFSPRPFKHTTPKKRLVVNTFVPPSKSTSNKVIPAVVHKKGSTPSVVIERKEISTENKHAFKKQSGNTPDNPSPPQNLVLPSKLEQLEVDQFEDDASYIKYVIDYFQTSLALPEMGEVRLTLIVDKKGEITEIQPVNTKSAGNTEYLINTLTGVKLLAPPLRVDEGSSKKITFTFINEN